MQDPKPWPRNKDHGGARPLCACTFERVDGDKWTIRIQQGYGLGKKEKKSRPAAFVAAGFYFTHSSFLAVASPDPFLPYVFMGEEMVITMRFWTNGFDIYAPEVDTLAHEYVR